MAHPADPPDRALWAGRLGRPGGALYGERLGAALGQQVIVEDKPGASGGVGAQMVAASAPDGYTFLLSPTAIMAITPGVRKVPYNPDDLVAVCRLSTALLPVTITNALGAKSWQEFVALAKESPGKYWFGSSGLGTITHLTGEVLTRVAGIQMQHAPYKTIVDATGDIFDGRIQMVFDPSFVPYAKAGKVRAVLVDAPGAAGRPAGRADGARGRARPQGLPRPGLVRPVRAQGPAAGHRQPDLRRGRPHRRHARHEGEAPAGGAIRAPSVAAPSSRARSPKTRPSSRRC